MALTKDKKNQIIADITSLLESSRLTVVAAYDGTPVKAMQTLRKQARENGTKVQVFKNRLVIKAMHENQLTKETDTSALNGMLLYAFNQNDEVAPAQVLAEFAKTQPSIKFVGGITHEGIFIHADDVTALASLPSKEQLRGILVGTISAPLGSFVNVLLGNLRGVLNVLNAHAESI